MTTKRIAYKHLRRRNRRNRARHQNRVSATTQLAQVQTALAGGVSRLLLQCRFDYRHRTWNFPAPPLSQCSAADEAGVCAAAPALLAVLLASPQLPLPVTSYSGLTGFSPQRSGLTDGGPSSPSVGQISKPD